MAALDVSLLDSAALSARLHQLAGEERNVVADFLVHLDELDRRRSYVELGYPSLWEYMLRALHFREGAAGRRIMAMRVLRRFPKLQDHLRDGRLCLSTLCVLNAVLTEENVDDVAERAAFKTKTEVEAIVASIKPRPAPADGIRRLPGSAVAPAPSPRTLSIAVGAGAAAAAGVPNASEQLVDGGARKWLAANSVATAMATPSAPSDVGADIPEVPRPASAPEVRAVAAEQWSLRVTLDAEARRELELLKTLLAHKLPKGDLAAVLKEAIRCGVEKHGKRKGAVKPGRTRTVKPAPAARPNPASIPAHVRREVWARDDGQCTWTAPGGTRCGSRWKLELDHLVPRALGGPATVENLSLRCRAHNLLHAEEVFGREHMERFRREPAAAACTTTAGTA